MVYVGDFDLSVLNDIEIKTVAKYNTKSKSVNKYYNIPCAFDIETSSTIINGHEKFAFMYIWVFGIIDSRFIIYGRTWEEWVKFCRDLQEYFLLDRETILPIYVHNLGYEFQFFKHYFEWFNVFASDERKPIYALTTKGIEFRDSYILSGMSLEKVAENLTKHKIKKLIGDLDYSLVRHDETPLTDEEMAYCNNDVEILLCYIAEQMELYDNNVCKIPMTNTGRVRKYVRERCYYSKKNHKKSSQGKYRRYRELMEELVLTVDEYQMLKRCFMGGFTHASMLHVKKLLKNVASIDFTSSYPYVMLSEKFPMSRPIKVDSFTKDDFLEWVNSEDTGLMFECKFTNIQSKLTYETYISESKCNLLEKPVINNGRVFRADCLETTITDIDFQIIHQCYTWDSIEIANVHKFYMQYLPTAIIDSILEFYKSKTTLKGVSGKETEYLVGKGMLNSVYGMCVTDIIRDLIEYAEEWQITKVDAEMMEEQIEKYNGGKNRFLYYPWGVWVTAYARRNLWNGILEMKDDYIYSDTDSLKFLHYERHKEYIERYNKDVERKLKKMCEFRKIDFDRMKPKTIKGIEKLIGVWDFEGEYQLFKTLGAKRYMVYDESGLHITIAGLSKQNGASYMMNQCGGNVKKVFAMFNDELYIPADGTGKNTHTYIDTPITADITDYTGINKIVTALSGVHLSPCDFTLSISKQYNKFLRDLKDGYLFTGSGVYEA